VALDLTTHGGRAFGDRVCDVTDVPLYSVSEHRRVLCNSVSDLGGVVSDVGTKSDRTFGYAACDLARAALHAVAEAFDALGNGVDDLRRATFHPSDACFSGTSCPRQSALSRVLQTLPMGPSCPTFAPWLGRVGAHPH
jgi:hypothetical protein